MLKLLVISVLSLLLWKRSAGYPYGMPDQPDVCRTMTPGHRNTAPQTGPPPFNIILIRDKYVSTDTFPVTIQMTGNEKFKGFSIQARRISEKYDRNVPVGYFSSNSGGTQVVCDHPQNGRPSIGNGLTHANDSVGSLAPKSSIQVNWNPRGSHGHIEFRVTVVVSFNKYWVFEASRPVRDMLSTDPMPTTAPSSTMTLSNKIQVNECGRSKGCYRNPPNCHPSNCDILMTWHSEPDYIDFEMVGDTEGWVAFGLSEDLKMGSDDVYECVANRSSSNKLRPMVSRSRNAEEGKSNYPNPNSNIERSEAVIDQHKIHCTFRLSKGSQDFAKNQYHLLMAKGRATENGKKMRHVLEPGKNPYVSVQKVSLTDHHVDITSTTRYVLVKVHGVLMLIGWMMCSSTALILAKYYKPMWPNQRICGEKVWFAIHRGCMAVNLFATIIGFIIIFIHANGYSQMPDLPAKAHPILGIITTILCILNPLIALCRCSEKSDKRPIFNWIHWFIGTCATVLATPTMFIGLNLPKAHVPWWATWVMVSFFLFHLIIELLLEIHGCLNASKQKYRTQEFEMRKPRDDREQEPVGKRFKKIILCIYVVVMIILGLVMIISIIAG